MFIVVDGIKYLTALVISTEPKHLENMFICNVSIRETKMSMFGTVACKVPSLFVLRDL